MMAGVEAIYTQELNGLALLQASYVHIWQSTDPMSAYVGTQAPCWPASETHMANQQCFENDVQRDMTHLISKRTNTGTGGIAYLDVNCGSFAYGFSANLTNTTNYNINSYSLELGRGVARAWTQLWSQPHPLVRVAWRCHRQLRFSRGRMLQRAFRGGLEPS